VAVSAQGSRRGPAKGKYGEGRTARVKSAERKGAASEPRIEGGESTAVGGVGEQEEQQQRISDTVMFFPGSERLPTRSPQKPTDRAEGSHGLPVRSRIPAGEAAIQSQAEAAGGAKQKRRRKEKGKAASLPMLPFEAARELARKQRLANRHQVRRPIQRGKKCGS
jgi:hypothetical protein